jgi:four helix bundle protein
MADAIQSYRDLIVWQKAMDLVVLVYDVTAAFPKEELYGLTAQMRRSAISIPSNIAEGRSRGSRKDFRQFMIMAYASGAELETQIKITKRLRYGNPIQIASLEPLLQEVMKMLNKLIDSLGAPSSKPITYNLSPET